MKYTLNIACVKNAVVDTFLLSLESVAIALATTPEKSVACLLFYVEVPLNDVTSAWACIRPEEAGFVTSWERQVIMFIIKHTNYIIRLTTFASNVMMNSFRGLGSAN